MLKNKIVAKKIRNIVVLLMCVIIALGAYSNIRKSKAEKVAKISIEVTDKDGVLSMQTLDIEAKETINGLYSLELPKTVNGNFVTKYYTVEGEEIPIDINGENITLQLTEEELENKKVQLETDYDKKEVAYNEESKVLYNKELKYIQINEENGEKKEFEDVVLTGYMPLDAKMQLEEKSFDSLNNIETLKENETIEMIYNISLYEEIGIIEATETGENITTIEKTEYNPSLYNEKIEVNIISPYEYIKADAISVYTIMQETDKTKLTKVDSTLENGIIKTELNKVSEIYAITVIDTGNTIDNNTDTVASDKDYVLERARAALPEGYKIVDGTNGTTGVVITDNNGNEFVWIDLSKANIEIKGGVLPGEFEEDNFAFIEKKLQEYASAYRLDGYGDDYASLVAEKFGLREETYSAMKKDMLASIYGYGGFFVGRYETGYAYSETEIRNENGETSQTPVIKKNALPYNYVTAKQAQYLANTFETEDSSSSLMFGLQWDLIMKYLEENGTSQADLKNNSEAWGNKNTNLFTTPSNIYYSADRGGSWKYGSYKKTSKEAILLSTGVIDGFYKQNMSDIFGNVTEYTLESDTSGTPVIRGGNYGSNGDYANYRSATTNSNDGIGFRVALWKHYMYGAKLKSTANEKESDSLFLGIENLPRDQIQSVTFLKDTTGTSDKEKVYIVSDSTYVGEIIAWYEKDAKTNLYKVYIASETQMLFGGDSSYLFAYIGSNSVLKNTTNNPINNMNFLDANLAKNMEGMFYNTGYYGMKELEIDFYSYNVLNMSKMFYGTGYYEMTNLKVSELNMQSVENAADMFAYTGYTKMTSLSLDLNVGDVTNMSGMFQNTGHDAMTSLSLGSSFNTENVTDMSNMFNGTGYTKMTSLSLGSNFNTSKVTNMSGMFQNTGHDAMTSLSLGSNFKTENVTNMSNMFNNTGYTKMTSLDLGPAFTKISSSNRKDIFSNTGKSNCVIYVPESIYSSSKEFKLNSTSTTTITYSVGTLNAKYRTEWVKESVTVNEKSKNIVITLRGRTLSTTPANEYKSNVTSSLPTGTVTRNDTIKIYIDGEEATELTKVVGTATTVTNTTTGANEVLQKITLSNFEIGRLTTSSKFSEWSGNITVEIAKGTLKDQYGNANFSKNISDANINKNEAGKMFTDFIKPEFTYKYSEEDINHEEKTLAVTFDITDKYFKETTITANDITVAMLDDATTNVNVDVKKTLTKISDITETINGTSKKIGEKYKLVIENLQKNPNDAYTYSGPISISFPSTLATDYSGNVNDAKTIIIGRNEPGGTGNQQIVDVVSPIWQTNGTPTKKANGDIEIKLIAKDKYLGDGEKNINLNESNISVKVNGVESTTITKKLSAITEIETGKEYSYTLTLSNIKASGNEYKEFEPLETIVGGTAKYKDENGGNIELTIDADTIEDNYGNTNTETNFTIGDFDDVAPEVYLVQIIPDEVAGTETIIFNVTDKNYDETDLVTLDEISTWLDGTKINTINKELISSKQIKTKIEGQTTVVGHQYTLKLSNIVESRKEFLESGRKYQEYSGNLEVKIQEDAARDQKGNTLNPSTTTITDFVDFIKPEIIYKYSEKDINHNNKTLTVEFEIIDKYFERTTIDKDKITVSMLDDKTTNINTNTTKELVKVSDITETRNGTSIKIGEKYKLVISALDKGDGEEFSGPMNITISSGIAIDTKGNTNNEKNITIGINEPDGSGSQEIVDVVNPVWELIDISLENKTIKFKAKDKYLGTPEEAITINEDNISIYVNGIKSTQIGKKLSGPIEITPNKEYMYELTLTNFSENSDSGVETPDVSGGTYITVNPIEPIVGGTAKYKVGYGGDTAIKIDAGTLTDRYGNASEEKEFSIGNTDDVAPEVYLVQKTQNKVEGTETIIFNVTDKNYDPTDIVTIEEISVLLDGQDISARGKTLNAIEIKARIDGKDVVIGHQYTLQLSNIIESREEFLESGRQYQEYSGNLEVKIKEDASRDLKGNTLNPETTTLKDFIDYIKPGFRYEYSNADINTENKTVQIVFSAIDKYYSSANANLNIEDLNILVDGENINGTEVEKRFIKIEDITAEINNQTKTIGKKYTLVLSNLQQTMIKNGKYIDYSGVITVEIPEGKVFDTEGNTNDSKVITVGINEPAGTGEEKIVDIVEPTWRAENINIDKTTKTVTVDLYGTDKYFKENTLTENKIKVYIDGEEITENENIKKTLSAPSVLSETRNGTSVQYGVKYTLTLSNWEQATKQSGKDYLEYSGTTKIAIEANTLVDKFSNKSKETQLELGHVDFIKPIIEKVSSEKNENKKTETIIFNISDKYLDTSKTLTTEDIIIYMDGEEANDITKTLTRVTENDITSTINGTSRVVLQQYKLVLSDFEKTDLQEGKIYKEWSGNVSIGISQGAIRDTSNNTTNDNVLINGDFVDFIKPVIEKESSTKNEETKTDTIIFRVTDKYLNTENELDKEQIKVYIDGEQANDITKTLIKVTENDIYATINGEYKVVSQQYELVLSDFEKKSLKEGKGYKEWSGDVSIKIEKDAVKDTSNNTLSEDVTMLGDKVDFIKPDIVYRYSTSDIDYGEKTVKVVFDVTDKYYASGKLNLQDITLFIDGENITDDTSVSKSFNAVELKETINGIEKVIGHRYTLTLSGLEQKVKKDGQKYLDYSGVLTVQIPRGKIYDSNTPTANVNDAKMITMGINLPEETGNEVIADVVDPLIENVFTDVNFETQEIEVTIRATDKYFKNSTLTSENIKMVVDGEEKSESETKTLTQTAILTEDRNIKGVTSQVKYGLEYKITIKNFVIEADQLKLRIPAGVIFDESGNTNKAVDIMIYNSLLKTKEEKESSSAFLGNTSIKREEIAKIEFVSNTRNANSTTKWDVSAIRDESIQAWYYGTSAPYTVYIGSDEKIFTNRDSSYLFAYIGYGPTSTYENVIENIELINTIFTTNMRGMFWFTGYNSMTQLDVSSLNTKNVTNMREMFGNAGYKKMSTLTLGNNFNTTKVTDMSWMFTNTGYTEMIGLNLNMLDTKQVTDMSYMFMGTGYNKISMLDISSFNTLNVEDMRYMFKLCGYNTMTKIDLGENFDTSNVKDMSSMFEFTGANKLVNFSLGNKFNTSEVKDMSNMFKDFGYKLTKLNLGDKFNTVNVNDMTSMFENCGKLEMNVLDLGPAFTKIANLNTNIFTNTEKTGSIIYAPESIYKDKNNFKLNTTSTTSIGYTRGTIKPKYRPEWSITGTTLDSTEKTIKINLTGATNTENYTSNVTSNLKANDIKVFIDKTELTAIGKNIEINQTTDERVTYTLTLSNLEEASRQSGKSYKEWSGNISLKINGRGESEESYSNDVLVDSYGNKAMSEIDTTGNWTDIIFEDEIKTTANANGKMFVDFIKPEFTYVYSDGDINYGDKTLKVTFDITDKYFNNTTISTENILVAMLDDETTNIDEDVTKTLRKISDITETRDGTPVKIGEKYELVISKLEKLDEENTIGDGYTYSGPMSITIAGGIATDNSGNVNNAKTITIGRKEPEGTENPEIVDVVDPIFEVKETSADGKNIKIRVKDKYLGNGTTGSSKLALNSNNIKVYVNNVYAGETVDLEVKEGPTEIIAGQEYEYIISLDNITVEGDEYIEFTPNESIVGTTAKYKIENGGSVVLKIDSNVVSDEYGNKNKEQELKLGRIDETSPEIYVVQKNKDLTEKTETIIFNVTDKNYDSTDLIEKNEISIWIDGEQVNTINKKSLTTTTITTKINGIDTIVGHQYILVLENFEETVEQYNNSGRKYKEYSGTLEVRIDASASKDFKGNTLNPATTTIKDFVDFVRPQVEEVNVEEPINRENNTYTVKFKVTDKYINKSKTLSLDKFIVYVDEIEANTISKEIVSKTEIKETFNKTVEKNINGNIESVIENGTYVVGYEYTVELTNFEQTGQNEIGYKDWSGSIKINLAGVVEDMGPNGDGTNSNLNASTEFKGKFVDFVKPVIEKISSVKNETTKTETIEFKVTDKYIDESSSISTDEIKIYVDGIEINDGIIKEIKNTEPIISEFKKTVGNVVENGRYTIGYKYTLELSGFEETIAQFKESGRLYKEWSGDVSIEIEKDAIKDTSENGNEQITLTGDFTDFIKPNIVYKYSTSDINYGEKTVKVVFDITDKYYASGKISLSDLTLLIDGEDITNDTSVTKSFNAEEIEDTINGIEKVIGHRYTLTLSGLEQKIIKKGKNYLDYSGVLTVLMPQGKIIDTSNNINDAKTITMGINLPDETGNEVIADVVDPLIEKVNATANVYNPEDKSKSKATLKLKVTDKYLDVENSTLTSDNIKVIVNGEETTGITKILNKTKTLTEERNVNGITSTVTYGFEYEVTLEGWKQNANQVKLQIIENTFVDKSGNGNKVTDLIAYNVLKLTNTETSATSAFLGNSNIQRQDIENVTFVTTLTNINANTVWDVSAQQDKSIMAWYDETSAPYTVYIGSDDEIFANQNSSYLFAYIGYANSCKKEETITNMDNLNTCSTTNMSYMFKHTGYRKMTELNLGNKFDTSNVTNMMYMFSYTGYTKMLKLDLTNKLNTSSVTSMQGMFENCGYTAMTELDLGDKFDTSNVTVTKWMFNRCGYTLMTNLDLGDKFNTEKVTDMSYMFNKCGYKSMASIDLGDEFDTRNVVNMEGMFFETGYTAMTNLDLGDKFYTTSVTNMKSMFNKCGNSEMTKLDFGPAFTKIASTNTDMFSDTGKTGIVIYTPESIYQDANNFKLNTTSTEKINYTIGTINAKYRTEWIKETTKVNIDSESLVNSNIEITLRGRTLPATPITDYIGDVESMLPTGILTGENANKLKIFIDGTEITELTKRVGDATIVTNETTGAKEVLQKITLSGFEVGRLTTESKFREWSGNITIQPAKGTLKDKYGLEKQGNQWINIEGNGNFADNVEDTEKSKSNLDGKMFADFIKPEFTYKYSEEDINYDNKTLKVAFDVTDKYIKDIAITENDITVAMLDDATNVNTDITKALTKTAIYVMNKETKEITSKAVDYEVLTTEQKVGERYELVIGNLQQDPNDAYTYSGPISISFPSALATDYSGNVNDAKTIVIGRNEPDGTGNQEIVDVVDPIWTGPHDINKINRENDTVEVTILGSDKYYASDVFAEGLTNGTINSVLNDKVKVYVDDEETTTVTKSITKITDSTELQRLVTNAGLTGISVGYKLTLSTFDELNGVTKIVLSADTIKDEKGNGNKETTILVGNTTWTENGDDSTNPRYPAFRQDIVDFLDPVIKYKYSSVEGAKNPEIDYEAKTLTVKFTVTDKYLVESTIIKADGTLNTDNVRIKISGTKESGQYTYTDLTDTLITNISSTEITNGYEYTLVIKNFEQAYNEELGYIDYSGIVQLEFKANAIDDLSGNKNAETIITIDTDDGDDSNSGVVVDVIKPLIEKVDELSKLNDQNTIYRNLNLEKGEVTVYVKATDKYLASGTLQASDITVKVIKPNGETVTPDTIEKEVIKVTQDSTSITYKILLRNFETNEGVTSIIIPADKIKDTSENGNIETELLVGNTTWVESGDNSTNPEYTAFRNSVVDFTRPVWKYADSKITRNRDDQTGTVTVKILGSDIYYLKDTLTANDISIYVANSDNPEQPINTITKTLTKITDEEELNGADTGYTFTLGNFGTYDGQVKIKIAENSMKDTSGIGNKETEILVGNPNWVETDEPLNSEDANYPKYKGFRNSIVDFIKPVITYKYNSGANAVIDQENKTVTITFDVTDTNFLESNLTANDIKVIVDDDETANDTIVKELTSTNIEDGLANGIRYTLKLSNFELPENKQDEIFRKYSGVIKLVIAKDKVEDTSGNKNNETTLIIDNDNGDSTAKGLIVDFIEPKVYFVNKFISWDKRYAEITLRGSDRFYDFNTKLKPEDIKLYQQNLEGEYIEITDIPQEDISITSIRNNYGYDFKIRIDNFETEYKMKMVIAGGKLADTKAGDYDIVRYNEETAIELVLDNKKPVWKYVSSDTSAFETEGKLSFKVKGQDKFLDLTNSNLLAENIKIYKDGVNITANVGITVNYEGSENTLEKKSKTYTIDVTGLTDVATYTLEIQKNTLVDEFNNKNNTTTITFSKSAIAGNTENYTNVTYYASPDYETVHQSYVHELMSVNKTGTNLGTTTYRPSSLGELNADGKNEPFAEPFKYENGTQTAYSFAGWAEADEDGFVKYYKDDTYTTYGKTKTSYIKVYELYDEILDTVTNLKAAWQQATVVFVSSEAGNNSNDGLSQTTPVKDLETAYSKLSSSGTSTTNIIVIMDEVEWKGNTEFDKNATITSLYAGIDYESQGAELKISSNFVTNGTDVIFDNIKLYADSTTVSDGSDYLAKGSYTNMLITNYGDITLGRGVTTPNDKYTFGAVVGGNFNTETSKGTIGSHTVRVEAGRYNNIIAGSTLTNQTTSKKYVTHEVIIGNMKDSAVSRNDNLTITGYFAIGELEDGNYAFNPDGSQSSNTAYLRNYANVTLLSGTFTNDRPFNKASENAGVYLRTIDGLSDGIVEFEMYGGDINSNVYAGTRMVNGNTDEIQNNMKFYGGKVTANIFGHGNNSSSFGTSKITMEGRFTITGNIFGGSNATTIESGKITGNTNIIVNSTSVRVNGNIYGGSNGTFETDVNFTNGYITGDTNITLRTGFVIGDIYGSGYNCGNSKSTNITIENGEVTGSIFGGAYQNQTRTATNITILGGIVNDIYGGNNNTTDTQQASDSYVQNTNITIGNIEDDIAPTVNGVIYGGGIYDKVGTTEIHLVECENTVTIYGGSYQSGATTTANIYLEGMTVNDIYGGSKNGGVVGTSNVYLKSGTVTNVYGGGYGGTTTNSNIILEGTVTVTDIYGGSNTNGTVGTSNVTLKSGTVTNVFGGGNSADVGTSNVVLDGLTVDTIHGGSKTAGTTTSSNVILKSGTVTNVFGGGYGGTTTLSNITFDANSTANVTNVYGGNNTGGITYYTNIDIQGSAKITGKLFGGGYKTAIGKDGDNGSTTINIAGGTIEKDINGGSEQGIVYGNTNINIGREVTNSSLTAGAIKIKGTIYGAGSSDKADSKPGYAEYQDSDISVNGETHINMINSAEAPITFNGSIYGAGNGSNYSNTTKGSMVRIEDFGTAENAYQISSVQKTDKVYIGNSYLELTGAKDVNNINEKTSYTLSKVSEGLTIYENTTLYTKHGFNKVNGFNSLVTLNGDKAQVTFEEDNTITRNVDNKIYTLEGINLVFAKEEGDLSSRASEDIWGNVNGMTFFGMYTVRPTGAKQYDIYAPNYDYATGTVQNIFKNGTYVEARHKASHDITADGFYTNIVDEDNSTVAPEYISTVDYGTYYDWIIGAETIDYNTTLIASTFSTDSIAELLLDKGYVPNTTYTVSSVSLNALDKDIQLIDKLQIPTISENSNNTFGLTMETDKSGWLTSGTTNIYGTGTDNYGSVNGVTTYETDTANTTGKLIFKLYNSVNVTEEKDLGNVIIKLVGKTKASGESDAGNTFIVLIAVDIQTKYEPGKDQFTPSFTERKETELSYTTDSKVDLTYLLYNIAEETPYVSGDYRVLSTTTQLPAGTRITLKDYGQGDNLNKVYYYHVTGETSEFTTEVINGTTRYIYRLSNFIEMGNKTASSKYEDSSIYYHSDAKCIFEKYDISIDFIDSNIDANRLSQETYLELRDSNGDVKYNNGDTNIVYNLYTNKNANMSLSISNENESYSIVRDLTVPLNISASILEQDGIMDTKYHDKIAGVAIEVVEFVTNSEGIVEYRSRVKSPELQNFKLINANDETEVYSADGNGVIRVPLIEGFGTKSGDYKLTLTQSNVPAGNYKIRVYFYSSDNGKHFKGEDYVEKQFNMTFINKLLGLTGVEATDDSRIINISTGVNLEGNRGLDMVVSVGDPTEVTNIRMELYKRTPTYTIIPATDETEEIVTYNGTIYEVVDLADYIEGNWQTAEDVGYIPEEGGKEYMFADNLDSSQELLRMEFKNALKEGIATGEYKLVFKSYYEDTLVQTVRKTFIVTQ